MLTLKATQNSSGLVRLLQSASAVREDGDWQSLQSTWPPPVGAAITGNIRLLGSLLQCLQNSTCPALGVSDAVAVLNSLLTIMGRPQVDSRVVTQATEAFLAVLQAQCHAGITSSDAGIRGVLGRLVTLLERNLVSMQWEIRDSTLEFISKLVVMAHQGHQLQSVLKEHHVLRQAWSCLQDGESYPRASTIAMATTLRQTPGWWNVFLNDCETTEMAVIEQMAEVLADSDTHLISSSAPPGGPSRREAVRLLSAIYQQSLPGSADLRQKFLTRVDEFDPAQHLQKLTVSMDEYDRQPESLLEDIVAAAKMAVLAKEAAFTSGDEFDDGEDIFVDCY
nr:hypothetical protein BaRGS_024495 [Batillaria attramentaria]